MDQLFDANADSQMAANFFIDVLMEEILENEPTELERELKLGDSSVVFADASDWYNDLEAADKIQMMNVVRLSMRNALNTMLSVLDGQKYLVSSELSDTNNFIRFVVYSNVYAEDPLLDQEQQPISHVPINSPSGTIERLVEILRKKIS